MKTKYGFFFIFVGIWLGLSIATQIGGGRYFMNPLTLLILFIFAILSLGYGFKLRRLAKTNKGSKQ